MKKLVGLGVVSVGIALSSSAGAQFSIKIDPGENLRNIVGGATKALETAGKVTGDVAKIPEAIAKPIATEMQKVGTNLANEVGKAQSNLNAEALKTTGKISDGAQHVTGEVGKFKEAALDPIFTGGARIADRQISGLNSAGDRFVTRVREGKFVDAGWHFVTDQFVVSEKNLAAAAQESPFVQTGLNMAATAYFGPYGAAAFTAWITYNKTGDANLALKMGLIAGLSSEAMSAIGKMPMKDAWQISQKVALAGAAGGLAVAAVGGSEGDIRKGVITAAGMMALQVGYEKAIGSKMDTRASKGPPVCKHQIVEKLGQGCGVTRDQLFADRPYVDGKPNVDMSKLTPEQLAAPHTGKAISSLDFSKPLVYENSTLMVALSKLPGVNAASIAHDQFAGAFALGGIANPASIPPVFVLTYYGTEAPLQDHIRNSRKQGPVSQ